MFRPCQLNSKSTAVGIGKLKQCFECEISTEEKDDNSCGKFDDSTEKCFVDLGGYCVKATSKDEDGYN